MPPNENPDRIKKMNDMFQVLCDLQQYSRHGFKNVPGYTFVFREVEEKNGINYTKLEPALIRSPTKRRINNTSRTGSLVLAATHLNKSPVKRQRVNPVGT